MAQLGRALRSGRRGRRFKSCRLDWHTWSVGQAVKTPPSHGGNRGSIPLRTTEIPEINLRFFLYQDTFLFLTEILKIMNSGQNVIFHVLFLMGKMVKYESGNTCEKELFTQKEVYRWVFLKR